jgi:hypothetical protein
MQHHAIHSMLMRMRYGWIRVSDPAGRGGQEVSKSSIFQKIYLHLHECMVCLVQINLCRENSSLCIITTGIGAFNVI